MSVAKALTIAGSDSGGGAGIQADLKTFQELGAYGMSVITAITAQNTTGVHGVYPVQKQGIKDQLDAIGKDLPPQALKTGMLGSAEVIETIAEKIAHYQWPHVVVDPVMVAKGGAKLLQADAVQAIMDHLLPVATVVTPNIPEAEVLANMSITSLEDRKRAAEQIASYGVEVVIIKGGHDDSATAIDLIYTNGQFEQLEGKRYSTNNTHGTGCTFSAAITAQLAKGSSITEAVKVAKQFIELAIKEDLHIGSGHGPTNHWAYRKAYV
ncbi:bifunctional hydroxymethylpyrimidine kinase/phosphomethylpyrimidine kinase [Pontibacillus litoralis]|uniref:Hydroxymethylpyrimidine/phosphomethylpyrimidine kinase n=1 Tax=Pontibacillus litoralis JSM 072002 TaxID=1385512 RepID=A0A0A5G1K7_9BACI|nr:bifunctional hydroxymethylpyrimidine kinase/phosphomethylpyrimidine kinase [Pontibacillus litoralis]KGX84983.1 phosphomethylpyrimidine kinase [Pontibacillus litoralis JSM 072002]